MSVKQGAWDPALGRGLLRDWETPPPLTPAPGSFPLVLRTVIHSLCLDQALHKQKGMKATMMRTMEPRTTPTIR